MSGLEKWNRNHPDYEKFDLAFRAIQHDQIEEEKKLESQFDLHTMKGMREFSHEVRPIRQKYNKQINTLLKKYSYLRIHNNDNSKSE